MSDDPRPPPPGPDPATRCPSCGDQVEAVSCEMSLLPSGEPARLRLAPHAPPTFAVPCGCPVVVVAEEEGRLGLRRAPDLDRLLAAAMASYGPVLDALAET